MNERVYLKFLCNDTRARVYLLWAVLATSGFVMTHFHQLGFRVINAVWMIVSIIGLVYMLRVMPMKVRQMRHIFIAWLLPISFGMVVSIAAFRITGLQWIVDYLGIFWLFVMAIGYAWNGLVDQPAGWYVVAALLNCAAALLCIFFEPAAEQQYLIAAIISAWSMINLWLFRT